MEEKITGLSNDPAKRQKFLERILKDLEALEKMLKEGMFTDSNVRIGAELEVDLVDAQFKPLPIALDVLKGLNDKSFTSEFALFNLEMNSSPRELNGKCFSQMQKELEQRLEQIEKVAGTYKAKVLITGILPTLQAEHLKEDMLTPLPRYRELAGAVKRYRGDNYEFHIKNIDELITRTNPGTFGGAFTSFQFHLQVRPDEIVEKYNWSQALLGPVLAVSVNSPLFLGKRLWQETRVPLFQQATDIRKPYSNYTGQNARVTLGAGWVKESILEVFQDNLAHYPALLGTDKPGDSMGELERGEVPDLSALQFYNGTIYPWNRVCYGITNGKPHLRIENRIFPAGPTMADQVANGAFWVGLMQGMPEEARNLQEKMPYTHAVSNFQKAARYGLEVEFDWLEGRKCSAEELVLDELLPIARQGLQKEEGSEEDITFYLGIIEGRVKTKKTGANWLLNNYNLQLNEYSTEEALETVTSGLYLRQKKGDPVHTWSDTSFTESTAGYSADSQVNRIMTTNIITINKTYPLKLAAKIFIWKQINHLPVEDDNGRLVGLLSKRKLFDLLLQEKLKMEEMSVEEVMQKDFIEVSSKSHIIEAINIMLDSSITCLPVVDEGVLVGLVTQHDFVKFSSHFIEKIKNPKTNNDEQGEQA